MLQLPNQMAKCVLYWNTQWKTPGVQIKSIVFENVLWFDTLIPLNIYQVLYSNVNWFENNCINDLKYTKWHYRQNLSNRNYGIFCNDNILIPFNILQRIKESICKNFGILMCQDTYLIVCPVCRDLGKIMNVLDILPPIKTTTIMMWK